MLNLFIIKDSLFQLSPSHLQLLLDVDASIRSNGNATVEEAIVEYRPYPSKSCMVTL